MSGKHTKAQVYAAACATPEEAAAKENLIAAAPDLLKAAERVYREVADGDLTVGAMEDLSAAITKAGGVA